MHPPFSIKEEFFDICVFFLLFRGTFDEIIEFLELVERSWKELWSFNRFN